MIRVRHYGGAEWGIESSAYSENVRVQSRSTPGLRWSPERRAWVGYVDAVDAAVLRLEGKGLRIFDRHQIPDPSKPAGPVLAPMALTDLREYQKIGVAFLVGHSAEGAFLADEMGLGKTVQGLRAARALRGRTVIVCPNFLKSVWHTGIFGDKTLDPPTPPGWPTIHEGSASRPTRVLILKGTGATLAPPDPAVKLSKLKRDVEALAARLRPRPKDPLVQEAHRKNTDEVDIVIVNYDILYAWVDVLLAWEPRTLIFDEAHMLMGDRARRTRAAETLAKATPNRILLSATPMTSRPRDLWAPVNVLSEGRFGVPFAFYKRHCCEASTPIWMGDYSFKPLRAVRIGDEVIGWHDSGSTCPACINRTRKRRGKNAPTKTGRAYLCRGRVVRIKKRRVECIEVRLASGRTVTCTADHQWAHYHRGRTHKHNEFGAPKIGMRLIHVATPTATPITTEEYKFGYILGALAGDGTVRQTYYPSGAIRNTNINLRVKSEVFADRFDTFARTLGFATSAVPYGPAMHRVELLGGDDTYNEIRDPCTDEEWRGWLAGIYDAEGSNFTISQSPIVNPHTHEMIRSGLKRFGFKYGVYPHISSTSHERVDAITIKGGRPELRRFFALAQPTLSYKVDNYILGERQQEADRIVGIKLAGKRTVIGLTTTLGNYVAGGYASKNCGAFQERVSAERVVWNTKGSSDLEELNRRLSFFMLRRTIEDVGMELPPRTRQIVEVDVERAFQLSMAVALQNDESLRRALDMAADGKLNDVANLAMSHAAGDNKIVIGTWRKVVAETLAATLRAANVNARVITGDVSEKVRKAILAEQPTVICATLDSMGVGLDLSFANVGICAELHYVPSKLVQWEGRLHRFRQKRPTLFQYVIARGTADELIRDTIVKKMHTFKEGVGKSSDGLMNDLEGKKRSPTEVLRGLFERMKAKQKADPDAENIED